MAGYKRVNFFELCRLCASNQQKEKTHIFQEEGRKIQLQNKIQSCLSLKVCENDFLPKVVCSQCLHSLEDCFTFRNECVSSEAMLSSYFNNFRHTDDFKKSGKVYIKDTSTKVVESAPAPAPVVMSVPCSTATAQVKTQEQQYYAVRVTTNEKNMQKVDTNISKIMHTNAAQPIAYNLNAINLATLKTAFPKTDGINEIINIEPDTLNSIISNSNIRKFKTKHNNINKCTKNDKSDSMMVENSVIQIDLTHPENAYEMPLKNEKLKSSQEPKYMYTFKIEENAKNPSFVLNQIANVAQIQNFDNHSNINLNSSLLNLASSVPQTNINHNNNISTTNMKVESEPIHKTASTINTSIFNSIGNNINLVPSNMNLTGASLNLVTSNLNLTSTNGANMMTNSTNLNLNGANVISSTSNQNNMQIPSSVHIATSNLNLSTANMNISAPSNINNQNMNTVVYSNNGSTNTNFSATNTALPNSYQNPAVNKNVLANLAVISRISNLSRTKTASDIPVADAAPINNSTNFNTVIFNGNTTATSPESNPAAAASSPVKTHVCDICQKVFKRREHLYQHVKLHTGFRPFVCEHCNKSFMRKEHLLRHMISHSGQKNYTCNICEKSFSRNDNLLKHKKTHDKQQSFTCEVCQKQFVMKHYYLAHKMAHEDEKVNFSQHWNNVVRV